MSDIARLHAVIANKKSLVAGHESQLRADDSRLSKLRDEVRNAEHLANRTSDARRMLDARDAAAKARCAIDEVTSSRRGRETEIGRLKNEIRNLQAEIASRR